MPRILITSGPTREYLDPVRFLSNASSGQMGAALAEAALGEGYDVTVVSGPVPVPYPQGAEVIRVVTTEEMAEASQAVFPSCDGVIAAAAPCDFRPKVFSPEKIRRSGGQLVLELIETPDIVASLVAQRTHQWIVAFALETDLSREAAVAKLRRKGCDLIVLNGPSAINSAETAVEVLDPSGDVLGSRTGPKREVARWLLKVFRTYFDRSPGAGVS
ncbi:MAG: phosphopantothenoylcysteine decarboxylase [Thermoguttaceae bacterium]|nr:phosphopantothenoylcysteine decarboxylase [Thermoguttaceae bacterium]MDW8078957.1 phosphopantothenoylcysteine decarboxylase [Thermoguttaceae bacterium]